MKQEPLNLTQSKQCFFNHSLSYLWQLNFVLITHCYCTQHRDRLTCKLDILQVLCVNSPVYAVDHHYKSAIYSILKWHNYCPRPYLLIIMIAHGHNLDNVYVC